MKSRKAFKRCVNFALVLILLLALVPMPAIATNPPGEFETVVGNIRLDHLNERFASHSVVDFVVLEGGGVRLLIAARHSALQAWSMFVVDEQGREIIPFGRYDRVWFSSQRTITTRGWHAMALYDMQGNNLVPYLEEEMIRPGGLAYWDISDFRDGFAVLTYGFYATNNGGMIPWSLEAAAAHPGGSGAAFLGTYRQMIIDETGRIILRFDSQFSNHHFHGNNDFWLSYITARVGHDGLVSVVRRTGDRWTATDEAAIYNARTGKQIMPYTGDIPAISTFRYGVVMAHNYRERGEYHCPFRGHLFLDPTTLLGSNGQTIIPFGRYEEIWNFVDGYGVVRSGTRFGFIDTRGNETVNPQFDMLTDLGNGYWLMQQGDRTGVIHGSGRVAMPLTHRAQDRQIVAYYPGGVAITHRPDEPGMHSQERTFVSPAGEEIASFPRLAFPAWLRPSGGGGTFYQRQQNWERHGSFIGRVIYIPDGLALYWSVIHGTSNVAVIDITTGREIIPMSPQSLMQYSFGHYLVQRDGAWHVLRFNRAHSGPSAWAVEQVNAAIAAGLVPQHLQSQFTQATTRAEFAALAVALYETATGREITGRMTFNDTTDINVQKMGYLGVVEGVGGGNFAPNNSLTREQAAVMLARLANAIGRPLQMQAPTFADNAEISAWARDAVGQVQAAGIMGGVGNNVFSPRGQYTREQSIVTMLRLFDMVR